MKTRIFKGCLSSITLSLATLVHSPVAQSFTVEDSTLEIKYYPYDTSITDITGNVTWDDKKVVISSYSKKEIKIFFSNTFLGGFDYEGVSDCDSDEDCDISDSQEDVLNFVDKVFKDYEKPEYGEIAIKGNLTVAAGTVVELSDGLTLVVDGGSITLDGEDEKPAKLKGNSWGGIWLKTQGAAVFRNCKISGAKSFYGAIRVGAGFNNLLIDSCEISNNEGFLGGGLHISTANPTIQNSEITNNNDTALGGGIYMEFASPTLTNNLIKNNSDASVGGGVYMAASTPTMTNNIIANNSADGGGGMFVASASNPTLYNNLIVSNTAAGGGGGLLFDTGSTSTIYNTTIAGNMAPQGSAIYIDGGSSPVFNNTIVYMNGNEEEGENGSLSQQIFQSGAATFSYSIVEGGFDGAGNVDADPLFAGPGDKYGTGGSGDSGDWSVQAGSPAINSGNTALTSTDLAGNDRVFNNLAVDIGAYEFQNNPPRVAGSTEDVALEADPTDEDNEMPIQICSGSTDPDNHDLQVIITGFPTEGGTLYQLEDGERGKEIDEDNFTVDDEDGWIMYVPANNSGTYTDSFECQVQDQPLDDEDKVIDEIVAGSVNTQTVTINVTADNDPPEITTILDQGISANAFAPYEFVIEGEDPDLLDPIEAVNITPVKLPAWLSLSRNEDGSYTLSGTPGEEHEEEENTVTLKIEDDEGNATEDTFVIDVGPQKKLSVEIGDTTSGEPNKIIKITASGSEGDTVAYNWEVRDEAGSLMHEGVGTALRWLPEVEGLFTATVTVSDEVGSKSATASADIAIGVGFAEVDDNNREEASTSDGEEISSLGDSASGKPQVSNAVQSTKVETSETENILTLSQLLLDTNQIEILLLAISDIASNGNATQDQTGMLCGILDNLIMENNANLILPASSQSLAINNVIDIIQNLDVNRLHLIKLVEVLNELVAQQLLQDQLGAEQSNLLRDAIATITQEARNIEGDFNASSRAYVKVDVITLDSQNLAESVVLGDPAEFQAKAELDQAALETLSSYNGNTETRISFASNATRGGHGVLISLELSNTSGDNLKVENLTAPISITIPVTDEESLTPRYLDEAFFEWRDDGIADVDTSAGDSVTFTTNHLTDFALHTTPLSASNDEPGSLSKVGESVEDGKSCFLDSLF